MYSLWEIGRYGITRLLLLQQRELSLSRLHSGLADIDSTRFIESERMKGCVYLSNGKYLAHSY